MVRKIATDTHFPAMARSQRRNGQVAWLQRPGRKIATARNSNLVKCLSWSSPPKKERKKENDQLGAHHPLSPEIELGLYQPRKTEMKTTQDRDKNNR